MLNIEYFYLFCFIFISLIITLIVFFSSFVLIKKDKYVEKNSAYECGFNPFEDARSKFDVRFYLVSILFLIFDLEIVYLFPWAVSISKISFLGFFIMLFFLFILTLGFVYEWLKGALEWS